MNRHSGYSYPGLLLLCVAGLLAALSCGPPPEPRGLPACCVPILDWYDQIDQQAREGRLPQEDPNRTAAVSLLDEIHAGNEVAAAYERDYDVGISPRLDSITSALAPHADRPALRYQSRLLRGTEQLNAFSIWGGHIYVTEALIETAEFTDGELAFVVGHEIAHAALRHLAATYERANSDARTKIGVCLATRQGSIQSSAVVPAFQALEASFGITSAELEFEADQFGALYLVRAGYPFSDAISALKKLRKLKGDVSDLGTVPADFLGGSILSLPTHPPTGLRIEQLEKFRNQLLQIAITVEQAIIHLESRRYADAARDFGGVLKVFPESRSMLLNLALVHHLQFRESQSGYDKPRGVLSTPERLEVNWSDLLLRTSRPSGRPDSVAFERAISGYRETLSLDANHYVARNNLAVAYLDHSEPERAIAELEVAAQSCGDYAPVYKNLALARCQWIEGQAPGRIPAERAIHAQRAQAAWDEYAFRVDGVGPSGDAELEDRVRQVIRSVSN